MTEPGTPVRGVTLYSFTRLFHSRELTFDQLVREVAQRQLGPGLEVVGFQSVRGFPVLPAEWVRGFRSVIDDTGLVPTALGANADAGLRRDRRLTDDELVEYMGAQLRAAATLGFPIVRVQFSVGPRLIGRLLPLADELDLTLGVEIHAHHSPQHPLMQQFLEVFETFSSPRLGFIPDWGATMAQLPRTLLESYRRRGVTPALIEWLDGYWSSTRRSVVVVDDAVQEERFAAIAEAAAAFGHPELAIEMAANATALFGQAPAESWGDVIAWAVHSHGKFYEIDADGEDPSVPMRDILGLYIERGYSRSISSEWEGFHWNGDDSALDLVAAQHRLLERVAETAGSRMVTDPDEARSLIGQGRP